MACSLSLDINAACPNTVIEAMSSGLPVVGFDTGALRELVPAGCGEIVDYGSDPWAAGEPDAQSLCLAIEKVLADYSTYSRRAVRHAQENFDIDQLNATVHESR